jgi:DNA-binding CsgD family transcriptional regulator
MSPSTKVARKNSKKEILARMLPQLLEKRIAMKQKVRQKKYGNFESLTPRQIQVIKLLLDGYRYSEIAKELFISVNTARNHVQRIYEILRVSGKQGLTSSLSKDEIDLLQKRYEVAPN